VKCKRGGREIRVSMYVLDVPTISTPSLWLDRDRRGFERCTLSAPCKTGQKQELTADGDFLPSAVVYTIQVTHHIQENNNALTFCKPVCTIYGSVLAEGGGMRNLKTDPWRRNDQIREY
jgi:hypothetical protein